MNVVIIAPHPDDESIGCGGVVSLHVQRGDTVTGVFLTSGELALKRMARDAAWAIREEEARQACGILGIARSNFLRQPDWFLSDHVDAVAVLLAPILQRDQPAIIYLPHPKEWHPDHQASLPIVRRALKSIGAVVELRCYEIWTPLSEYDHVENITLCMPKKLEAIRAYRSQLADLPYDTAISALNQYRGIIACRSAFAEVFQSASCDG